MASYKKNYRFDHGGSTGVKTYDYAGTLITHTSTSGKKCPKSGLPRVKEGATYLNLNTGACYRCTKGVRDIDSDADEEEREANRARGDAANAEWSYVVTRVIGAPTVGVTGLKIARRSGGSRVIEATWKVPDSAITEKAGKSGHRVDGWYVAWYIDTGEPNKLADSKYKYVVVEKTANERKESATINLASFTTAEGKPIGRSAFHPHKGKQKLKAVTVTVVPYNRLSGAVHLVPGHGGTTKEATLKFAAPRKPTVSALSFDAETGVVSGKVTVDAGNDKHERLWTQWELEVTDTSKPAKKQTWTAASDNDDARTSIAFSYNASNYQSLAGNQYIRVRARARTRGYAGNSDWAGWKSYYIAFPKAVTIEPGEGKKKRKVAITSDSSRGRVTVPISVNATKEHPTDRVKLQKLVNVDYADAAAIPGDADWQDTGSVDDGSCTALVVDVADLMPDRGKHTWIRVKSWHGSEESLHTYSKPREMVELFEKAATASDDECKIISVKPLAGGDALRVVIGYDGKGQGARDDATGTVLEWSDDPDAWKSNKGPEDYEFTWRDDTTDPSAASKYYFSQTVKVRGLEEGTTYWLRARRYHEDADGKRTYGTYSPVMKRTTASLPSDGEDEAQPAVTAVALSAPAVIESGSALPLSWTVAASAEQDSWAVMASTGQVLAQGSGTDGGCSVPWERVAPRVSGGAVSVYARATAGGAFADSPTASVRVAERPVAVVSAATLAAQPMSFTVESDVQAFAASYAVRSDGCSGSSPSGGFLQAAGDVVAGGSEVLSGTAVEWVDSLSRAALASRLAVAQADVDERQAAADAIPEGADGRAEALAELADALAARDALQAEIDAGGDRYQATVTLGEGLEFHDGATYRISASVTDSSTGLASDAPEAAFTVAWAHQAVPPSEEISVEPLDDAEGADPDAPTRAVAITLVPPDGAAEGDVYDVYRVTHDGAALVSGPQGLPLDHATVDRFAPFGDAADYCYRVALRTPDGDVEWADYNYAADVGMLRFDFAGRSVELPYKIEVGDAFQKGSEVRAHMDGGVEAFWNASVKREARLSTEVMRVDDADDAAAVRALAQHAGPVFVRTPDGSAYEADVQVDTIDVDGPTMLVAFDAKQVDTSPAFMLPPPEQESEEQEG